MTTDKLFDRLASVESQSQSAVNEVKSLIATELSREWSDWKALHAILESLESFEGVEYKSDVDGIYAWIRFYGLSDIGKREREYFEDYLSDIGYRPDFENDCISNYLGDDHYQIQDDSRHDNGVWQGHKIVIKESEYRASLLNESKYPDEPELSEDDDESRRNALIEAHMERSGCYPGVYRVTQYGDVFPVNTSNPKDKK
jgi:hypothetical protein